MQDSRIGAVWGTDCRVGAQTLYWTVQDGNHLSGTVDSRQRTPKLARVQVNWTSGADRPCRGAAVTLFLF
jgi:hypothetical protein